MSKVVLFDQKRVLFLLIARVLLQNPGRKIHLAPNHAPLIPFVIDSVSFFGMCDFFIGAMCLPSSLIRDEICLENVGVEMYWVV